MSSNVAACIPANPDIAGIGIRAAVYVQNFLGLAIGFWSMGDGKLTKGEARVIWTHTTGVLITSCALFLSAIVQAKKYGMSTYHTLIILNLGWINNTSEFMRHFISVHRRVSDRPAEGWICGMKTNSPLLSLFFGSFHTQLLSAFGLWFWATVDTFANTEAQCEPFLPVPLHILGHIFPVTSPAARKAFLVIYGILITPFRSLLILPMIAGPGIILLLIFIRPCVGRKTMGTEALSNLILLSCMVTMCCINIAIIIDTEAMIRGTKSFVGPGEDQWTFGQTIAMFLLVPPIIEIIRNWRESSDDSDDNDQNLDDQSESM